VREATQLCNPHTTLCILGMQATLDPSRSAAIDQVG
jgi:hypothetical protein